MKNATILADAPTTSLKLAYSYLLPIFDLPNKNVASTKESGSYKKSTYKNPYTVHPAIREQNTWDHAWFSNYE
ncbi:MAG TPA: hypothetical protein VM843_05380 [Flavisolibacter sp.]|jgi:hypothetical protein|nr:hypothetical protein [Flavisolibacter sp.]